MLNGKLIIRLTHKTTQGTRIGLTDMTRRQYWICYYGNIYYITDAVQTTQLDLIGSIILKLAKLVCGNHQGVSFYIFDTSLLVVVATPNVLKS